MIIVQYSEQVLVEIINKLYSLKLINERINYKLVDLINNISANYEKQELIQILKQSLYIVNTNYLMKVFNYLPTKPLELIQQRIDHYK